MPKKIRELKQLLKKAGFVYQSGRGKGSHTMWYHPLLSEPVILSGKDGADAQRYQERDVLDALKALDQLKPEKDE